MEKNLFKSPITSYNKHCGQPKVSETAHINPFACIIGDVIIDDGVMVAPFVSVRGDEGTPIFVGKNSNLQDGVVLHGLKDAYVQADGQNYSVYIDENVSLAHQSQVHGPSKIGKNVFVGFQSLVHCSEVGCNVMIDHGAKICGVKIPSNKYVPVGAIVTTQQDADNLPNLNDFQEKKVFNQKVLNVNIELAKGYIELDKKN